jgi:hypothetical protein
MSELREKKNPLFPKALEDLARLIFEVLDPDLSNYLMTGRWERQLNL